MKKFLSMFLMLSVFLSIFQCTFAMANLKDIDGTEYEFDVKALLHLDILSGYADGTFRPNSVVSRAEMAKIMVVAAGLEPAADLAQGATKFSDVNGGWASGYINIATEYGFVSGYSDGTFKPDSTVSYAEAITMALRVLGYKSVIEEKGTWPTNYISKANDLALLEGISYNSYNDGIKRGNMAILTFNMLNTETWEIIAESNGAFVYGVGRELLEVKFPKYSYSYAEFVEFTINEDKEVEFTLNDKYEGDLESTTYIYEGNDFYTFISGAKVEVLVNESENLVLLARTTEDVFVEESNNSYEMVGIVDEIVENKLGEHTITIDGEVYEIREKENEELFVDGIDKLDGASILYYIKSINGKEYVKVVSYLIPSKITYNIDRVEAVSSTAIAFSSGDIETFKQTFHDTYDDYYFVRLLISDIENEIEITTYEELVKGTEIDATFFSEDDGIIFDNENEVVWVIEGMEWLEENLNIGLFLANSQVERTGASEYEIELEQNYETELYKFENIQLARALWSQDTILSGTLVAVHFNDDDEIIDMKLLARISGGMEDEPYEELELTEKNNYKTAETKVIFSDENNNQTNYNIEYYKEWTYKNSGLNIDKDVEVISLLYDNYSYSAVFETGVSVLEFVNNEEVLIIADEKQVVQYIIKFDFDEKEGLVEDLIVLFNDDMSVRSYLLRNQVFDYINADDRILEKLTSEILLSGDKIENFDNSFYKKYSDYLFVKLNIDSKNNKVTQSKYAVRGAKINVDFFEVNDAIIYDDENKSVWVIRGLQWPEVKFFAVVEEVEKIGVGKFQVVLENEDGKSTYSFTKSNNIAKEFYSSDTSIVGTFVAAYINSNNEIIDMKLIAKPGLVNDSFSELEKTNRHNYKTTLEEIVFEENSEYQYDIKYYENVTYNSVDNSIEEIKVDDSTMLVTLEIFDNGTYTKLDDDEYTVKFEKGKTEISKIKDEEIIIVIDKTEKFQVAKYLIRFEKNINRADNLVGVVEEAILNEMDYYIFTIDGENYTFKNEDNEVLVDVGINIFKDATILFSTYTDEYNDEYAIAESYLLVNEATDNNCSNDRIIETSYSAVAYASGDTENFKEPFHEKYDDYLFIRVVVDSVEQVIHAVEDPVNGFNIEAQFFKEDDGIIYDDENKVVWVIEGLDWIVE